MMEKTDKDSSINQIEHELHDVEDELQTFEERQVSVTRTLQMIVYPAMVAFIILSAYGFFLVQSLTTDVHRLTETIAKMNDTVHSNMNDISGTMNTMNSQMGNLVQSTGEMTDNIVGMNSSTQSMANNVQQMNASTQNMAVSTYNMQRDMWSMNKNISGPMKMFNKFSPFGNDKTSPYVVPPPMVGGYPSYNTGYATWPQQQVTAAQPATQAAVPQASAEPASGQAGAETAETSAAPAAEQPAGFTPTPANTAPADAATAKDGHSAVEPESGKTIADRILTYFTRG